MKRSLLVAGLLLLASAWAARGDNSPDKNPPDESATAESPSTETRAAKKSARRDKLPLATPEREAAALMFVRIHHPELSAVLEQLKANKPEQYDRAIRELFRTCEQLNRTQDNDVQKYALDLEAWKVKSRIQLLAARASLGEDPALDQQLREAANRQSEIRIEQLALQREQLALRLAKLDEQLADAKQQQQAQADKHYAALMRSVSKARSSAAKKQKPAKAKPAAAAPAPM
ncbi:MAG: hypothetical protein AB7O62_01390 [Pirellulales bacterium]